jgi:hypothetical protein
VSALQRLEDARAHLAAASPGRAAARDNLELRREAYRTVLDAGRSGPVLERVYEQAGAQFRRAQSEAATARRAVGAVPAAGRADDRLAAERERRQDRRELITFLLRFAAIAASLGFGYWLLARLRRDGSRYFPVAVAVVAYAAIFALVLAADYITDYVDPLDLGPLVLSLFGIAVTLLAFAVSRALPRPLDPAQPRAEAGVHLLRLPGPQKPALRGLRQRGSRERAACGADRRVGVLHCGACGAS